MSALGGAQMARLIHQEETGGVPAVSVGLPVYNGERFLARALDSILGQSWSDFELVVTDNASTDRTGEICRDYAAGDPRVRYLRNNVNLGAAANYNRAFAASRAMYFKWAAHDDEYHPEFLADCVSALEANPAAVACYSAAVFIDDLGAELGVEGGTLDYSGPRPSERLRRWVMEKRDGWCHPVTGLIRRDVLAKTPRIAPFVGSDVTLVAELLLHGAILRTEDYLFYRRDHGGRSVEAHRSMEARTEWFDTSARHVGAYMPFWRLGTEFCRAVARTDMPWLEKSACAVIMARWFARSRSRLKDELMDWAETGRGPARPPEQRS